MDYTFAVSVIAMGAGGLFALAYGWALSRVPGNERAYWRLFSCMPFLIPSYLLATTFLGWLGRHGWLGPFQGGAAGRIEPVRIWACGILMAVSGWPLVLLVSSWVWDRIDPCYTEAAELDLRPLDRWLFVYLPLFGRPLLVGLGLLFLWSSLQFMVPLALSVPVAAVRIHARFNTYFQLSQALSGSFWTIIGWLAAWIIWVWLIRGMSLVELSGNAQHRREKAGRWRGGAWAGRLVMLGMLFFSVGLPLAVLVRGRGGVWQAFLNIGRFDRGLLVQTAVLAGSSAMLATLLGGIWVLGASVYGRGIRMKPGLEIRDSLLLLPWLMPGVLLGAICVRFLSSMPGAGWFYPSTFFLAMLLAVRVLFAPAKVLRLMAGTLPRSWFEAWELHQLSKFRLMTQLLLPLLAPAFVIGWAIAYWLILAETGLVVMVAPPGVETLMMRVFHLLHYGYEDEVAAACLWVLVLGLGPFLAGVWALGRIRKARSC